MPGQRCVLKELLGWQAMSACIRLYETAKQLSMSCAMEEALIYIVSDDVSRKEFKKRSEEGDVIESDGMRTDFGNYLYAVLYHLSMFYRCRHSDSFKKLYEEAKKKYPTLDREHEYTYKSLIRQGDAIEVALAIAWEKGPDMSFMTNMEQKLKPSSLRSCFG